MHQRRAALTMMELLIVLVIMVALAGMLTALVPNAAEDGRLQVTKTNMNHLQEVILGAYQRDMTEVVLDAYRGQPLSVKRPLVLPRAGFHGLNNNVTASGPRPNNPQLRYLFVNPGSSTADNPAFAETTSRTYDPVAARGWRGPYIMTGIGKYPQPDDGNFTRDFGEKDDPTVMDGWHHPIVILEISEARGAELRSAGKDGLLLTADDIVLALN